MTNHLDHLHVFIMAGGVGTRFWPESKEVRPKQFLKLTAEDQSMIQQTAERYRSLVPDENIYVITAAHYVDLCKEHLPYLADQNIIAEPLRKNTAPATLLGAHVAIKRDQKAICHFAPADAYIGMLDVFQRCIVDTYNFLSKKTDAMSAIGMVPTHPHTGYGYLQVIDRSTMPYRIKKFTEKPDYDTALSYLNSGDHFWNAGIFSFPADYYISLCKELAPEMALAFEQLEWSEALPTEDSLLHCFQSIQGESIDYLIAENAPSFYVFPGEFTWSDIGSWSALKEFIQEDDKDNVTNIKYPIFVAAEGNLVRSKPGKTVVIKGLDDYAVVDTDEVLLIYPLSDDQEIKNIRAEVQKLAGDQYV